MSLTDDDLKAIKGVIRETVQPMVDKSEESLAIQTANGFAEVDRKFERLDQKLDNIEVTINKIDNRSFGTSDKVDDHEVRISKLEKQQA